MSNSTISTIKLRYFRENSQEIIDAVRRGKSFIVMKRSKPVLKLSIPDVDEWGDEGHWTGIDLRDKKHPNGMPAEEFLEKLRKIRKDLGEI
ncbi:hypothetical protein FWD20_02590 [Candidatus Saccharibacteria bacterium]|nr:hypothetical protein [Candidatus Saccharibacteria bacterium]